MDLWVHIFWTNTIRQHHGRLKWYNIYIWKNSVHVRLPLQRCLLEKVVHAPYHPLSIFKYCISPLKKMLLFARCPHPFQTCILAIEHFSIIPQRSNRSLLKGPTFNQNNALFFFGKALPRLDWGVLCLWLCRSLNTAWDTVHWAVVSVTLNRFILSIY